MEAPAALRGSVTPVVTPFAAGRVDLDSFAGMVDRQARAGSAGVVVTGTTGEPSSLDVAEREALYRVAVEAMAGRGQVVAATGASSQQETLRLTKAATSAGADAVMVVVPPFVKPSQRGLVEHFATAFAATDLPALIYHIPGRSGTGVTLETVLRVADRTENLVGLKSASPDLDFVTQLLLELGSDFRVFCGVESLSYPMLALGGAGLMNAVGNLDPERLVELCEAVRGGDHQRALELHRELFAVNRAIFFDTNPVPLKHMLALHDIAAEEVRPPLVGLDEETRARVGEAVGTWTPRSAGVV